MATIFGPSAQFIDHEILFDIGAPLNYNVEARYLEIEYSEMLRVWNQLIP